MRAEALRQEAEARKIEPAPRIGAGSVVSLKSGGVLMTVLAMNPEGVRVAWMNVDDVLHVADLPLVALEWEGGSAGEATVTGIVAAVGSATGSAT